MSEITSSKLSIQSARLPSGAGTRVIDVGCGDGRHIAAAAARGCFAVGVDYDAAELRKARERLGALRVDLVVADASRLPFHDGAFDAAICTETLEHLPDDGGATRELSRVTRDGGLAHIAVPSHFTELVYWRLSHDYSRTPGGHVRIYGARVLATKLARAGLRVEDARYVHFIDSLMWLRFCIADFARGTRRPVSDFEAAVLVAMAADRRVPSWRRRLRRALGTSRFIAAIDAAGAFVWPKSLTLVARKTGAGSQASMPGATDATDREAEPAHAVH
jgi:SAM-dependent methyltransferase